MLVWLRSSARGAALVVLVAACGGAERTMRPSSVGSERVSVGPAGTATMTGPGTDDAPRAVQGEPDPLRARDDLPASERALLVVDGAERWVKATAAQAAGYTLIDLRDSWTPSIFAQEHTPEGEPLPNRYRRVYVGLAGDQLDSDGEPLEPGEKNYLELYGVPPALSVLRARFLASAARPCRDQESVEALEAVETVSYVAPKDVRKRERRIARLERNLEAQRRRAKVATLEELAAQQPGLRAQLDTVSKHVAEQAALAAVERRLECEQLLPKQRKHTPGVYDHAMRLAVRAFQQKHMIYEASFLRRRTVEALSRTLLDNDYAALVRVLSERVVDAAGIIEDGTGGKKGAVALDLVGDYTQRVLDQLGLGDAASALAFFERHPSEAFQTLRAAVKLPPLPEYYGPHMELSIVVDRGDVWYDLPFDAQGRFRYPPRSRFPSLTLFTTYEGRRIVLARWRSTIGGWRAEQGPDGYEYYRYKGSDVGPRVIRQVISGPVWIAPESTPIRSLVKGKKVNHVKTTVVNYDELGPGYLSAYGLVAGYFVTPGRNGRPDWDNGIRAHGSSDYLSIYSSTGYSHGCHRLPNHIAVRLYSFILRHRKRTVRGDQPVGYSRQFLYDDSVYEIRIPSRGFAYELDPPVPVEVLEGTIRGKQKQPIPGYVPKPDTEYPGPPPPTSDSPEAKAGGEGGE